MHFWVASFYSWLMLIVDGTTVLIIFQFLDQVFRETMWRPNGLLWLIFYFIFDFRCWWTTAAQHWALSSARKSVQQQIIDVGNIRYNITKHETRNTKHDTTWTRPPRPKTQEGTADEITFNSIHYFCFQPWRLLPWLAHRLHRSRHTWWDIGRISSGTTFPYYLHLMMQT